MQASFSTRISSCAPDKVLVVEDDSDIVEILSLYLGGSGYDVLSAGNGVDSIDLLRSQGASMVLVDLMMPSMNGFDFIKEVRTFSDAPIVIVSARNQPSDKMLGLDLGADGYITKPFDPMEVLAYVRAMLRRYRQVDADVSNHSLEVNNGNQSVEDPIIYANDLELNRDTLVLRKRGVVVPLTASELKILMKLLSCPGRVFTKTQLYESASGSCYGGSDSVMVHVSNIRSKIEDNPNSPSHIMTVRGLGYRFEL